jgi:hypothetical protein
LEKNLDELTITDGVAQLAEFIGHQLEALAVGAKRRGALNGVANLSVEVVDPSVGVVLKEATKGSPERSSGRSFPEDEVKNLGGHPRVDPLDDGEIVFDPAGIIGARNGVGGHVRAQVAAAKVDIKKMRPMIVVVGSEV